MELYSVCFLILFLITLFVFYNKQIIQKNLQWIVLLSTSLIFYLLFGWKNTIFILITSISIWGGSVLMDQKIELWNKEKANAQSRDEKKQIKKKYNKKLSQIFLVIIFINIGILSYLKYWDVCLSYFKINRASQLILPLGISYYTFQSISYLIDVKNGRYSACKNFFQYLLFMIYFPQLIQGPINRFNLLQDQLIGKHEFKQINMQRGLLRFGYGMLKKYAIADLLFDTIMVIVSSINPSVPGSFVVVGILLYSIQQYCDFSGGIDMVMAVSEMLDIHMSENFKQPYFAINLGDFWRRWHITLGSWMRDYIFYPVALSKPMLSLGRWCKKHCSKHIARTLPACIANIIVFLVVGLWHGAQSHFILWGLYNGVVIALSDLLSPIFQSITKALKIKTEAMWFHVFRIIRTFIVVNIGWYFDLIENFNDCKIALHNTFTNFQLNMLTRSFSEYGVSIIVTQYVLVAICCVFVFGVSIKKEKGIDVRNDILQMNVIKKTVFYCVMAMIILISFSYTSVSKGFMYANF